MVDNVWQSSDFGCLDPDDPNDNCNKTINKIKCLVLRKTLNRADSSEDDVSIAMTTDL